MALTYGTVVGRFVEFSDLESPLSGKVIFTPTVSQMQFPSETPPVTALQQARVCPVIDGNLYDSTISNPTTDTPLGVSLLASDQPNALPSTVQYKVVVKLDNVTVQPSDVYIDVPANSTVDLANVIPAIDYTHLPVVVSQEERILAQAAQAQAEAAAQNAAGSATGAQGAAQASATSAQNAAGSASQASDSATNAQGSATSAASSASLAFQSASTAEAYKNSAATSKEQAASSATLASAKALAASDSATSAASSSTSAQASALAAEQAKEQGSQLLVQKGNVSGTLDLSTVTTNQIVHLTRVGNIVVNLPTSPMVGQTITLVMKKDSTATVYSFGLKNVTTAYGVTITPSSAANTLDEIMCFYDGVRWKARVGGLADSIPASWVV